MEIFFNNIMLKKKAKKKSKKKKPFKTAPKLQQHQKYNENNKFRYKKKNYQSGMVILLQNSYANAINQDGLLILFKHIFNIF